MIRPATTFDDLDGGESPTGDSRSLMSGPVPETRRFASQADEMDAVREWIYELCCPAEDAAGDESDGERVDPRNVCVVARNRYCIDQWYKTLDDGLPYGVYRLGREAENRQRARNPRRHHASSQRTGIRLCGGGRRERWGMPAEVRVAICRCRFSRVERNLQGRAKPHLRSHDTCQKGCAVDWRRRHRLAERNSEMETASNASMFYTKKELALKESVGRKKGKRSFIWKRTGGMIMDMRHCLSFIG